VATPKDQGRHTAVASDGVDHERDIAVHARSTFMLVVQDADLVLRGVEQQLADQIVSAAGYGQNTVCDDAIEDLIGSPGHLGSRWMNDIAVEASCEVQHVVDPPDGLDGCFPRAVGLGHDGRDRRLACHRGRDAL
jgi:hypothetical protein